MSGGKSKPAAKQTSAASSTEIVPTPDGRPGTSASQVSIAPSADPGSGGDADTDASRPDTALSTVSGPGSTKPDKSHKSSSKKRGPRPGNAPHSRHTQGNRRIQPFYPRRGATGEDGTENMKGAAWLVVLLDADSDEEEHHEHGVGKIGRMKKAKRTTKAKNEYTAADRERDRVTRETYAWERGELTLESRLSYGMVVVGLAQLVLAAEIAKKTPYIGTGMRKGSWWSGMVSMLAGGTGIWASRIESRTFAKLFGVLSFVQIIVAGLVGTVCDCNGPWGESKQLASMGFASCVMNGIMAAMGVWAFCIASQYVIWWYPIMQTGYGFDIRKKQALEREKVKRKKERALRKKKRQEQKAKKMALEMQNQNLGGKNAVVPL